MELAVSALLLLLLLLPGFILQFAYTKGSWRWNSPTVQRSVADQIPSSMVSAGVLHCLWYPIASNYEKINLGYLMMFLLGHFGHEEAHFDEALASISEYPGKIAIYFLSLYVYSALIGYVAHMVVRSLHLDHQFRFFRFNNEWFYWLRGEITQFKETTEVGGQVKDVYLTSVVHHEAANYLYTGYVRDFFFDKSGNLDRIILEYPRRRKLGDDEGEVDAENRYYDIVGDYFILRYSEMCTINLNYVVFNEAASGAVPDIIIESLDATPEVDQSE
jgi:hypothetical protein